MKNNSRNGVIFLLVIILAIIGYSLIHLYCKGLKSDISSGTTIYENNRKKQPVNNIVAIKKGGKPRPTVSPSMEPTLEPTVEPTLEPTVTPTVKPTKKPTTKPTNKPNGNGKTEEEVSKNIVFEYDYDEGNYIYLVDQFPIRDEVGKSLQGDKRKQDFKLKFNGDAVGVKYTITVEKLDGTTLDDEWAKMFLVADGADVRTCFRINNRIKTFNDYNKYNNKTNERIIYEGTITSNEDFTFRMWVSEDLQLNNSNYLSEERTYKTRINVYAREN